MSGYSLTYDSCSPLLAVSFWKLWALHRAFKNHHKPGLITRGGACKKSVRLRCFLPPEEPRPRVEWAQLGQLVSLGTNPMTASQGPFEHLLMSLLFPSRNLMERTEVEDPSLNSKIYLEISLRRVCPYIIYVGLSCYLFVFFICKQTFTSEARIISAT